MNKYFSKIYNNSFSNYCKILDSYLTKNKKKFIITANPETITIASHDEAINEMLTDKNNDIVPDGIAIVKAGKILGFNIKERIAGVDIAEYLLNSASSNKYKVYLFGSKQEVIDAMKNVIRKKYSGINLVGATNGYVKDKDKEFEKIKKSEADIILVALGIPIQEKLIYKHIDKFDKGIFVGVGGSFDVISGCKKRAPKLFIKLNLEWLYRIICEPKRIKRFWNNNIKFIINVRKIKNEKSN